MKCNLVRYRRRRPCETQQQHLRDLNRLSRETRTTSCEKQRAEEACRPISVLTCLSHHPGKSWTDRLWRTVARPVAPGSTASTARTAKTQGDQRNGSTAVCRSDSAYTPVGSERGTGLDKTSTATKIETPPWDSFEKSSQSYTNVRGSRAAPGRQGQTCESPESENGSFTTPTCVAPFFVTPHPLPTPHGILV